MPEGYLHPHYSRQELIQLFKNWLKTYRDNLNSDSKIELISAIDLLDQLVIPIITQDWITKEAEPSVYLIVSAAKNVEQDYYDKERWDNLINTLEKVIIDAAKPRIEPKPKTSKAKEASFYLVFGKEGAGESRPAKPSRKDLVNHAKAWAKKASLNLTLLTSESQTKTILKLDALTYPIRTQEWIDFSVDTIFGDIIEQSNRVVKNHTNLRRWVKLFHLIESLEDSNKTQTSEQISARERISRIQESLIQYARKEVIDHCKAWAEGARFEYPEIVTAERSYALYSTQRLLYPIEVNKYLDWEEEPQLAEIVNLTERIEENHTNPARWEKLIKLIDAL